MMRESIGSRCSVLPQRWKFDFAKLSRQSWILLAIEPHLCIKTDIEFSCKKRQAVVLIEHRQASIPMRSLQHKWLKHCPYIGGT
jgi:hypothetical protein